MDTLESLQGRLDRIQGRALVVGIAGAVVCAIGLVVDRTQFFQSYLYGFLFWLGLGLGCLSLALIHHLTGGRWGIAIRRFLESGMSTLPLMALLFIPLVFGTHILYEWANEEHVQHDPVLLRKVEYLNVPFFYGRAVIYFVVWVCIAWVLNSWSMRRDTTSDFRLTKRLQLFCGPAILAYALTMTFASVDWAMSLEPHWFSTMYGVLFLVGQGLNALAFVIVVAILVHSYKPFSARLSLDIFHDLGKLLLAATMLWAYVNFSQFLIIWSGNLPEETPWYITRNESAWQFVTVLLMVFHFFVPFLLLLSRRSKRNTRMLLKIALLLIVMRFVDLYWVVYPAYHWHAGDPQWRSIALRILLDIGAPVGIGGLWIAMFCRTLKSRAAVPVLVDPHH